MSDPEQPVRRITSDAVSSAQAVGIDLVDVQRLRQLEHRWGTPLMDRLFTRQEQAECRTSTGYRWQSLAGRFGAKEAVMKILAPHGIIVRWTEVEVHTGAVGEPLLELHGRTRAAFEQLGLTQLLLSISHEANLAIAIVIAR